MEKLIKRKTLYSQIILKLLLKQFSSDIKAEEVYQVSREHILLRTGISIEGEVYFDDDQQGGTA